MAAFLFRCPATGLMVQGWRADDGSAADTTDSYVGVQCLACSRMHLINPSNGHALGSDDDNE
jgi:hypothetical protein